MTRPRPAVARLSWAAVLAWRMRRQLLDPIGLPGVVQTVSALDGEPSGRVDRPGGPEGGRVAGVWELDDQHLAVSLFEEDAPIDGEQLERERERLATRVGRELRLSVATVRGPVNLG